MEHRSTMAQQTQTESEENQPFSAEYALSPLPLTIEGFMSPSVTTAEPGDPTISPRQSLHLRRQVNTSGTNPNDAEKEKKPFNVRMKETAQSCAIFIYNSENNRIFNHTLSGFLAYIGFLMIYYAYLAGMFILLYCIFITWRLPTKHPYLMGQHGLHRALPGLTLFPMDQKPKGGWTNVLSINGKKLNETFVKSVIESSFNADDLGECQDFVEFRKKYASGKRVCIYAAINRLYGWVPPTDLPPTVNCKLTQTSKAKLFTLEYFPSSRAFNVSTFPVLKGSWKRPLVAIQITISPNQTLGNGEKVNAKCWLSRAGDGRKFATGNPQMRSFSLVM